MKRRLALLLSLAGTIAVAPADDFPTAGIMPRVETGAAEFLKRHPEFDGRGVTVAILDSGVDPGAAGLQTTPDGRPKIVDLVDGSGSGDVDMTEERTAEDGVIEGLTGRKLKLDPAWTNPTGRFRIGAKPGFELFPSGLVSRMKKETREDFEKLNRAAIREAQSKLRSLREAGEADDDTIKDAEARVKVLGDMMKDFDAPGPVYDCVAFNDGEKWRAVVDTDEDGDFSDEVLMTNFRDERRFASFGDAARLNFALNIYDDGDTLSIVVDASPHATHVAGIVGGYFPAQPELNGVAPGAQIVSVKIGDTRIDGMETTTGIIRGLATALQDKCDLINMSYGEPTTMPNDGRLNALISEVVNEHGVIYVSSAGNAGPALSTVGSPGGTTSAIFGVGAYISEEMMPVQYSLRRALPENLYTWSSRGPTFDGGLGVNFCAPGGAFAPIPNWTLQGEMQMNGTSMASPNACGSIALMLSGLKQDGIAYSPSLILRAVQNTARRLEHVTPFAQGRGLIQVGRAYDYLVGHGDDPFKNVRYEIGTSGGNRGILLRETFETNKPFETTVRVLPKFREDDDNSERIAFSKRVRLAATRRWIKAPEFAMLFQGGDGFSVEIDAQDLEPGAHYGEILGIDTANPEAGPLFRVPVTVIRSNEVGEESRSKWHAEFHLETGDIERNFLDVPEGATWADVAIHNDAEAAGRRLVFHTVQQVPGNNFRHDEHRQYIALKPGGTKVVSIPVEAGRMLELTVAQYWSSLGEGEASVDVSFRGIVPSSESLYLDGGDATDRIDLIATLDDEAIAPSGTLTHLRRTLRPTEATIQPLTDLRDQFPGNRTFSALLLTYRFEVGEDSEVMPRIVSLQDRLYESEFASQLWTLLDENGRLLRCDDTFPDAVAVKNGAYTLKLRLGHDDLTAINKVKDLPIQLGSKLAKPVALRFHRNPDDALLDRPPFHGTTLEAGDRLALFMSCEDDPPSEASPGDTLAGALTFGRKNGNRLGGGDRPGGYPVVYRVPALPAKHDSSETKPSDDDSPAPLDKLREDIRDLKTDRLAELYDDEAAFNRLLAEILDDWPDHLPALVHKLRRLDDKDRKPHLDEILKITEEIISKIDADEIRRGLAIRGDEKDAEKRHRKELGERRAILIDTLYRRARAFAYREDVTGELTDGFDNVLAQLREWVDTSKPEYILVHIRDMRRKQQFGSALVALNEHISGSAPEKRLFDKRIRILGKLGWTHWIDHEQHWNLIRFPAWKQRF